MSYIDGYVISVPSGNKDAYLTMAREAWPMFKRHGALAMMENWGDDVPHGKLTDFYMAVKAEPGETIVFSWMIWPSKDVRDAGMKAVMEEWQAKPNPPAMPFDGKRMIMGGFAPLFDSTA